MTLNMHPDNLLLARGFAEIVQSFGWRSYTIIYESERGKVYAIVKYMLSKLNLLIRTATAARYTTNR